MVGRVADRWLRGSALWTVPYLEALAEAAVAAPGGWGQGSPAARVLRKMIRSAEAGNLDPFEVSDLWPYLSERDVDADELALLGQVPAPRTPLHRGPGFHQVWTEFERSTGKSTILTGIDLDAADHLVAALEAIAEAVSDLPAHASRVWKSQVRKVRLRSRARGSEDASWEGAGVLSLSLDRRSPPAIWRSHIVHELGHALEDSLHLNVSAWDSTPYGAPPYVSDYAEVNASEDFAETFRAYELEPALLRRLAPAKHEDMAGRVR